jgi:hypothetical protein
MYRCIASCVTHEPYMHYELDGIYEELPPDESQHRRFVEVPSDPAPAQEPERPARPRRAKP